MSILKSVMLKASGAGGGGGGGPDMCVSGHLDLVKTHYHIEWIHCTLIPILVCNIKIECIIYKG